MKVNINEYNIIRLIREHAKEYAKKVDDEVYNELMKKEFDLSKKIGEDGCYSHLDVKEFIKKTQFIVMRNDLTNAQKFEEITKLAGNKLT